MGEDSLAISKFGQTFISYGSYHYNHVYASWHAATRSSTSSASPSSPPPSSPSSATSPTASTSTTAPSASSTLRPPSPCSSTSQSTLCSPYVFPDAVVDAVLASGSFAGLAEAVRRLQSERDVHSDLGHADRGVGFAIHRPWRLRK